MFCQNSFGESISVFRLNALHPFARRIVVSRVWNYLIEYSNDSLENLVLKTHAGLDCFDNFDDTNKQFMNIKMIQGGRMLSCCYQNYNIWKSGYATSVASNIAFRVCNQSD